VVELISTRASVVGCFADPDALDALPDAEGTYTCRVAPDEVMLVGEPGTSLLPTITDQITRTDPEAVVLDVTDGWVTWTLAGAGARDAFEHLSAVPLGSEGYTQGDVAHVPIRVIALPESLHLFVPAMWSDHLRERILTDCATLDVRVGAEPAAWAAPEKERT